MYRSPMKDFGYDISNFTDIDPIFGTLEDFKRMSDAFKERGMFTNPILSVKESDTILQIYENRIFLLLI